MTWRVALVGVVMLVAGLAVDRFLLTALASHPDGKHATGVIGKFTSIDARDQDCTTSSSFVSMPDMVRIFTQGGSGDDEVVVLFQGEFHSSTLAGIYLQLYVDGFLQPGTFVPRESQTEMAGFNWVTNPVTPGSHTVRIKWASVTGDSVCVADRSMIILHK